MADRRQKEQRIRRFAGSDARRAPKPSVTGTQFGCLKLLTSLKVSHEADCDLIRGPRSTAL